MASGGEIELELFPELAPFTVYRMATLSGEKVFDGLCFHRHSPNWVVQGGSPLGHELVGLSPFMPDECGRHAHLRGTVGISTRSADTGDAQFFINLCDNHVLNHDYTVWARVVRGMDVVDGVLPGDTMSTVRLCTAEANARGAAETACCC
jgi:cyclophilin family peptidyl-prolyl cis-trans isomerase